MTARDELAVMLVEHGARSLRLDRTLLERLLVALDSATARADRAEHELASFALNNTPEQEERARRDVMRARRRWLRQQGLIPLGVMSAEERQEADEDSRDGLYEQTHPTGVA
jgi:multidrug resistance efflux pump